MGGMDGEREPGDGIGQSKARRNTGRQARLRRRISVIGPLRRRKRRRPDHILAAMSTIIVSRLN